MSVACCISGTAYSVSVCMCVGQYLVFREEFVLNEGRGAAELGGGWVPEHLQLVGTKGALGGGGACSVTRTDNLSRDLISDNWLHMYVVPSSGHGQNYQHPAESPSFFKSSLI